VRGGTTDRGDDVEGQATPPLQRGRSGVASSTAAGDESEEWVAAGGSCEWRFGEEQEEEKKLLLHAAADGWEEKPVSHIRDADELTESLIM